MSKSSDAVNATGREFSRYMFSAHLLNLKIVLEKKNLQNIISKISISLLRYSDLVRIDKLYYDAGMACKKQNVLNLAHVFLNRYLDLYEVIEDPEGNPLSESPEFALTDIPSPFDCPLAEKNLISAKDKDELSDWLVKISMQQKDKKEGLSLNLRKCEKCQQSIADMAVRCPRCSNIAE